MLTIVVPGGAKTQRLEMSCKIAKWRRNSAETGPGLTVLFTGLYSSPERGWLTSQNDVSLGYTMGSFCEIWW